MRPKSIRQVEVAEPINLGIDMMRSTIASIATLIALAPLSAIAQTTADGFVSGEGDNVIAEGNEAITVIVCNLHNSKTLPIAVDGGEIPFPIDPGECMAFRGKRIFVDTADSLDKQPYKWKAVS